MNSMSCNSRQDASGSQGYIFILFVNYQCSQLVKFPVIWKYYHIKIIKMVFTTAEKRNRKLIHEGHMYVFQKNLANDVTS